MAHRIIPIRASSFGRFFDCAYAWEYEYIQKNPRLGSLRTHLGSAVHHGTAVFDQAVLNGDPITAFDAAGAFVDYFVDPKEDVDLKDKKLSIPDAQEIGVRLVTKYCTKIAPTMHYESVEMALEPMDVDCGDGLVIRLTGTMDRARVVGYSTMTMDDGQDLLIPDTSVAPIINDVKTGQRLINAQTGIVSVQARAAQTGIYELLYWHTTGVETDGSQITALQTSKDTPVGVSRVFKAKDILLDNDDGPGLLTLAAKSMKEGLFLPNPQSPLCSDAYCARRRAGKCKYVE